MNILPSVVEGIKIQFNQPMSMRFNDTYYFKEGGFLQFTAYIQYEVIGAYLENDRIQAVVNIYKLNCTEFVIDYAITSFEKKVKSEIARKIPEAEGNIDIYSIKKFLNNDDEQQRRSDL